MTIYSGFNFIAVFSGIFHSLRNFVYFIEKDFFVIQGDSISCNFVERMINTIIYVQRNLFRIMLFFSNNSGGQGTESRANISPRLSD